jgi:adenylate cyclase
MPSPPAKMARSKAGRIVSELGSARVMLTIIGLIVALLIARGSWELPLLVDAERSLYDWRTALMTPRVDQDQRITMVVYDDDTLINTRKRSPLDRAILARALGHIDAMNPKAVGIDILFDQPQDEDPQLIAALKSMKAPTHIAYAAVATNGSSIAERQQAFLDDYMKSVAGGQSRPSSIRVEADEDNVERSWSRAPKGLPPVLPVAMAGEDKGFSAFDGSIAWRLPKSLERPVFSMLPIDLFADPETASAFSDQIKGRLVLVGGNIRDTDQFETPLTATINGGSTMIGLEVHATMLAQLLDGVKTQRIPNGLMWLAALLVVAGGGATALLNAPTSKVLPIGLLQVGAIAAAPLALQWSKIETLQLPAFGWLLGWLAALAVVGAAARVLGEQQRAFAQSALGSYLPKDVAAEILKDPERLSLSGEKREIFIIFTDLEGFTEMSHDMEPETVATLLNRYLDVMCGVVLSYGGTVDKFVGDAIVAFWGAPISRLDDGERAARAAYAMWEAGENFRKATPPGVQTVGRTRVGLHWGEAVVGNFGGQGRIQYTALGDSMNTASRLENANKKLGTSVLASREAVERSGLDWWRPLGRVGLRGRAAPVDLYEPVPNDDRSEIDKMLNVVNLLDKDPTKAKTALKKIVLAKPQDPALANFLARTQKLDAGGVYALD